MQRYGLQSAINHSAWTMDDVTIKFWNGSCYMNIYQEDFNMQPSSNEGSIDIIAGSIIEPPCGSPGTGPSLYFNEPVSNFITMVISYNTSSSPTSQLVFL